MSTLGGDMRAKLKVFYLSLMCAVLLGVTPTARAASAFLYALNDVSGGANTVYCFAVDDVSGALMLQFSMPSGGNGESLEATERMAVDSTNARLYVLNAGSATLSIFSINRANGTLTPLPFSPFAVGSGLRDSIHVHANGTPLVIGDATSAKIASVVINGNSIAFASGSPVSLSSGEALSTVFSKLGDFVYTGGGSSLPGFSVDTNTGVLTALSGSPFATSPQALATDLSGRIFGANATSVFAYATSNGIPTGATGNPFASGLTKPVNGVIHSAGFYMVADRGDAALVPPAAAKIAVYSINGSGTATTLAHIPGSPYVSGSTTTDELVLDRNQNFLYAAHSGTRNISTFNFISTSGGFLNAGPTQTPNTLGSSGRISGLVLFNNLNQPVLSSMNPPSINAGGPAFNLTLTGTNFTANSVVRWSGQADLARFGSPPTDPTSQITVQVPASYITLSGTSSVSVLNPGSGISNALIFAILGPPRITSSASTEFMVDNAGNFTVSTAGNPTAAVTVSGSLPSGVTFKDNGDGSGLLSGTPTVSGTFPLTFTAANGFAPNATQSFTLTVKPKPVPPVTSPPVVTLESSNLTQMVNQPVTFTISATDSDSTLLNYMLDFGDGSPVSSGQFTQGTVSTVAHTFTVGGTFTVTASVDDTGTPVKATVSQVIAAPNSGGEGQPNISDGKPPVMNPIDGLTISVLKSDGGVVMLGINVDALNRALFDVNTEFGDIDGRTAVVSGLTPVHQFGRHGIFIAKTSAIERTTGIAMGRGRKTLIISTKETGETLNNPKIADTGLRAAVSINPNEILTGKFKGKFIFNASKSDSVNYSATIALPAGIDTSKPYELSISIGNVVANTIIDKGKAQVAKNDPLLKSLKISYVKLKKGAVTQGGELAKVSATLATTGMVGAGFDTEGIVPTSKDLDGKRSAPRSIQVAMLVDGVPYEVQAPVTFVVSKDSEFGSISGRK